MQANLFPGKILECPARLDDLSDEGHAIIFSSAQLFFDFNVVAREEIVEGDSKDDDTETGQ